MQFAWNTYITVHIIICWLFQPLYTLTWTNLQVTYSEQTRGWSESTLILVKFVVTNWSLGLARIQPEPQASTNQITQNLAGQWTADRLFTNYSR
jgi:hypothetical protein